MQDVVLYARELSQDTTLHDDEKENIAREMAQLQEHYDELRNFVEDEQDGFVKLNDLLLCLRKYVQVGLTCQFGIKLIKVKLPL